MTEETNIAEYACPPCCGGYAEDQISGWEETEAIVDEGIQTCECCEGRFHGPGIELGGKLCCSECAARHEHVLRRRLLGAATIAALVFGTAFLIARYIARE